MFKGLRQSINPQQRQAYWEAIIAVCALVAAREGKLSFEVQLQIDRILESLPDLKDFDRDEFDKLFDRFVEEFRRGPSAARLRALETASNGVSNADEAELLARIALAIAETAAGAEGVKLEPIEALCDELNVDAKAMFDAAWIKHASDTPLEPTATAAESSPENTEAEAPKPTKSMIEKLFTPPSADQHPSTGDLGSQLQVNGTRALIALCGRTKTGAFEALRIYQDEQLAAADCELSERIANEKFWLSPVALFPSDLTSGDRNDDDKPEPAHVLCLRRPDGNIEALRAFENANQAHVDLEFFQKISDVEMWVSVVLPGQLTG